MSDAWEAGVPNPDETCEHCQGSGYDMGSEQVQSCPWCNGSGHTAVLMPMLFRHQSASHFDEFAFEPGYQASLHPEPEPALPATDGDLNEETEDHLGDLDYQASYQAARQAPRQAAYSPGGQSNTEDDPEFFGDDDPDEDPGQEMNQVGDPQPSEYFMEMHGPDAPNPADSGNPDFGQVLNPDYYSDVMGTGGSGLGGPQGTNLSEQMLAPGPVMTNTGLGSENNNGWGMWGSLRPGSSHRASAAPAPELTAPAPSIPPRPEWLRQEASQDSLDIAQAAREHLARLGNPKTATKVFTPAEQRDLINEGEDDPDPASNFDLLKLSGTSYEKLEEEIKKLEAEEDWWV